MTSGAVIQLAAAAPQDEDCMPLHGLPTFFGYKCHYAVQQFVQQPTDILNTRYHYRARRLGDAFNHLMCKIELNNDIGDYQYDDIFESIELKVGPNVIETQTTSVIKARETMPIIRDAMTLYINLPFWFCSKDITQSIPIISLMFFEIFFNITLKQEFTKHVYNMTLIYDVICLDKNERRLLNAGPSQYTFYQYDEIKPPIGAVLVSSDECHYLVDSKKIDTVVVDETMTIIEGVKKQFRCENGMGQLI